MFCSLDPGSAVHKNRRELPRFISDNHASHLFCLSRVRFPLMISTQPGVSVGAGAPASMCFEKAGTSPRNPPGRRGPLRMPGALPKRAPYFSGCECALIGLALLAR